MSKTILTEYNISTDFGLKIAHVSDLHEKNADRVIELLKESKPDIILLTGDMLERREDNEIMANGEPSP